MRTFFSFRLTYITFVHVKVTRLISLALRFDFRYCFKNWTTLSRSYLNDKVFKGNGRQMCSSWHAPGTWLPSRVHLLVTSCAAVYYKHPYFFMSTRTHVCVSLLQLWDLDVFLNEKRPVYWPLCNKVQIQDPWKKQFLRNWKMNKDYLLPLLEHTSTRVTSPETKSNPCSPAPGSNRLTPPVHLLW